MLSWGALASLSAGGALSAVYSIDDLICRQLRTTLAPHLFRPVNAKSQVIHFDMRHSRAKFVSISLNIQDATAYSLEK